MNKNLHVMSNGKSFPNKFVPDYARLLTNEIKNSRNEFLVLGDDFRLGEGFDRRVEAPGLWTAIKFCFGARRYSKIVFHSIVSRYILLFLFLRPLFFRSVKLYMVIWGGEIHFLDKSSFSARRSIWLNKLFMKSMDGFITYLESDYKKAVQLSGNRRAKWINIQGIYPSNAISDIQPSRSDTCQILIGTSALERNRHFEIIDFLSKTRLPEKVEYIIPLSYGDKSYAKKVFEYAERKLSGKVTAYFDFIALNDYLKILSTVDVALFNNDGQQGMGNIRNLLSFGAQVFLNPSSDSYHYFKDLNFDVMNINEVPSRIERRVSDSNRALAQQMFSQEILVAQTEDFLARYVI